MRRTLGGKTEETILTLVIEIDRDVECCFVTGFVIARYASSLCFS